MNQTNKAVAVAQGIEPTYIECPYNKSHQILPDRMKVHLIRCRKSYPNEQKVPCPYNSTHIVAQCELEYHIANCVNQISVVGELVEYESEQKYFEPAPIVNTAIECSENWDNINVPTYDPTEHLENNIIIRNKQGCLPSERKAFREQERRRIQALKDQQNKVNVGRSDYSYSTNESKVTTFRRPNTVSVTKKATTAANNAQYDDNLENRSQASNVTTARSTEYDSSQSEVEVTKQFGNMSLKNDSDEFVVVSRKKSNLPARGRGKRNPVNNK